MKTFEDQVRPVIESNTNPTYDKAQALRLYVEKSEMDILVAKDTERYKEALEETGGMVDDIEPISRFHEAFQADVDAAYAAAVVGLETEALLEEIRANVGLQNAGLLVLANPNGSMKRDVWTDSFGDIIFALDFPESFTPPTDQTPTTPGAVVRIPDPNLRAAIAEALGKSPNAPITMEEMGRLGEFDARNRGIQDLTGLQFATNLSRLLLNDNQISDISPISGLTELRSLQIDRNTISDISPVRDLKNLTFLNFRRNQISDISPIAGLINLNVLWFSVNSVSDLSPVAGLINLNRLSFSGNNISDLSPIAGLINLQFLDFSLSKNAPDISPLAGLVNLKSIRSWGHSISDISPLANLTKLESVDFCGGNISNLTPLAGLTGLKELYIASEKVSDISPLAGLTGLTRLSLENNDISDISPLAGLTNLKWLKVPRNNISDFSPLDGLRENIKLIWFDNPAFPKGGPKIEGPWLWVWLPDKRLEDGTDLLSEASGGAVTEVQVATHGTAAGNSVGDKVWSSHRLPPAGENNIGDMLQRSLHDGVIYGSVSLHSPQQQDTTMYVGSHRKAKVWLNGVFIYENSRNSWYRDYQDLFPVTLQQGKNVLLVATNTSDSGGNFAFFGFEPGTEYTVANPGVGYTFSQTPIHAGDTFTLDIGARDIFDMAGWQFDIVFNPTILEAISVSEGDFLKMGSTTFFQSGSIDNVTGKITGLSVARLSAQGVTGTGVLLQVRFKAKSAGETELALQNVQFGDVTGTIIAAGPHQIRFTVEAELATGDVNRDGVVSILDLILIAQQLGRRVAAGSPVDLNGDGVVSILDLILTARSLGNTTASAAPSVGTESVDAAMIAAWIAQARLEDDGSLAFKQGIEILENLLASLIPEETALLANYPNPFNPETWIPYQLSDSAEVTLTIYDTNGQLVRHLVLGHQAAGMYRSRSRAAYWDGRNQLGESVASGLYFYTLTTDDFTATRRMLILK